MTSLSQGNTGPSYLKYTSDLVKNVKTPLSRIPHYNSRFFQ